MAIAIGVLSTATFVQSGAFLSASTAAWAFTTALMSNPLTWVAVVIGVVYRADVFPDRLLAD